MKISVIIPAYDEKSNIRTVLNNVKHVPLPHGIGKEIIVIDDGSNDGTKEMLQNFIHDPLFKIFSLKKNMGKTYAVKFGIAKSSGDFILIQDADLEYHPKHYPSLLEPILNNKCSVVYGSRFKGSIKNMALINRLANRISNFTINILFNCQLSDFHTCFKLFKKEVLSDIEIVSKNFSFDTEITAKLLDKGYQIFEVPIDYVARERGEGKKITWASALETYFFLLKYRFKKGARDTLTSP